MPRTFDGQAYYDRHIKPFVEEHGEHNGPVKLVIWPPAREPEYYRLADWRLKKAEAKRKTRDAHA